MADDLVTAHESVVPAHGTAHLIRAAIALAARYDADPVRGALYALVLSELADLIATKDGDLSEITLPAVEQIFAKYALPTANVTKILESL